MFSPRLSTNAYSGSRRNGNAEISTGMRYRLKHMLLVVVVVALAAWSIQIGVRRTRRNIELARSSYAGRLAAEMCVEHMKTNGQQWPKSWDDLADEFGPCLARSGQSWSFAELKQRVGIDWNTDLERLMTQVNPPDVIWIVDDPDYPIYGLTPNEIVKQHVKSLIGSRE